MSNILDRVFAEVCLDERISDGIFRMEEEAHMNALRDYFVKKGITQEVAVKVTNRMLEGKYPERQAYRKEDGILVTWPSPQHKQKAMQKNPGKYVEQDPNPKQHQPEPEKEKTAPPGSKPEPGEKPNPKDKEEDDEKDSESSSGKKEPTIFQGEKELEVEPPRGEEQPVTPPPPQSPTPPPVPRTPERIAAEKEVVKQIMKTDDTVLSNVADPVNPPMNEALRTQLNELYKKADEMGFREAVTFLTKYVKP